MRTLLWILALTLALPAVAETVFSPRTKAEHEADVKALESAYGPARKGSVLEADSKPPPFPIATPSSGAAPAASTAPAPVADAQRVRVSLLPEAGGRFKLNNDSYDTQAMIRKLTDLNKRSKIDAVLLIEDKSQVIEVAHIVELAKIGQALKLPTLYQQGQEFKSISTK